MKQNKKKLLATACIPLIMCAGSSASGVEVYKWAGSDGVTHYAEAPPESALASLEILKVIVAEPVSPVVMDYQSVLDVANSIEASRLERERVRLEREKLFLQEKRQRLAQQQYYENYAGTNVYYLPYSRYRHHRKKPYPHNYGNHPGIPHNGSGQPHGGSTAGRVNLSR